MSHSYTWLILESILSWVESLVQLISPFPFSISCSAWHSESEPPPCGVLYKTSVSVDAPALITTQSFYSITFNGISQAKVTKCTGWLSKVSRMHLSIILKLMLSNGLMASAVVTILYLIVAKIGSNLAEDEAGEASSSSTITTVWCKYLVVVQLLLYLVYQLLK